MYLDRDYKPNVQGAVLDREEAKKFIEYNAAAGWKLEWRYALKLWLEEKPKREERHRPKGKTGKIPERKYDFGNLEQQLLKASRKAAP